jgi:hypothetical protein
VAADNLWWSVWWQWLAVWAATVVALLIAVATLVVQWRGRRKRGTPLPYVSLYLHEQSVMDLYQFRYQGALEQQVEARVGRRTQVRAGAGVSAVHFGGNLERNREEFRKYLEVSEPITVIGILMDVLEDDIIHVDLQRGSLMAGQNVDIRQRRIRLSELGGRAYVLARGGFEAGAASGASSTVFLAPYGNGGATGPSPAIRVRCANSGLRGEIPDGRFWARCLGTVQGWDRDTGQLVIDPIAIFK